MFPFCPPFVTLSIYPPSTSFPCAEQNPTTFTGRVSTGNVRMLDDGMMGHIEEGICVAV